ncbi:hypothetical protein BASA62_008379, partial [Batrachochytrium salamandrivorans]
MFGFASELLTERQSQLCINERNYSSRTVAFLMTRALYDCILHSQSTHPMLTGCTGALGPTLELFAKVS